MLTTETRQRDGQVYVAVTSGQIMAEQDGVDLVGVCFGCGAERLLLPAASLSDEFLRLSTRVCGLVMQKLGNYHIKAAAVLGASAVKGKFADFLIETNRGRMFRSFENEPDALDWLLADQ